MPPITPSAWKHVRIADRVSAVCPQNVPVPADDAEALLKLPRARVVQLHRLSLLLSNQSEDCLYLNLYVPRIPNQGSTNKQDDSFYKVNIGKNFFLKTFLYILWFFGWIERVLGTWRLSSCHRQLYRLDSWRWGSIRAYTKVRRKAPNLANNERRWVSWSFILQSLSVQPIEWVANDVDAWVVIWVGR